MTFPHFGNLLTLKLGRPQGLVHRDAHRVELVIPRHLLDQRAAAVVLEHDEVADERENPPRLEDALQHHLELRHMRVGQRLPRDGAPGLEPLPPRAVSVPTRDSFPSDTKRASFMENSAGSSDL